jgi:hypothetical protein
MTKAKFRVSDRETGEHRQVDGLVWDHDGRPLLGIHETRIDGRSAYAVTHCPTGALICATDRLGESTVVCDAIIKAVGADHPMAWSSNRLAASEYLRDAIMAALLDVRADYYLRGRWRVAPSRSKEREHVEH